ncbi:peptidoglycan-binding protein [Tumidithrix elongata RA019]|uniref:Peptidoglycan-binding protein n=1 Tax=Tumidithrix elongata BACA0141 TaxID=2716417 RepID=A0AAW9PUW2_9CYAN|nr:peptidoglycan-binding protein [Tumidithrix elongata RA019]
MEFDAYLHGALVQEQVEQGIDIEPNLNCAALNATFESAGAAKTILCTGLAASTLVVSLSTVPVRAALASGSSSSDISFVQSLLARRGFDPGAIDGIKGSATEAAIAKAQTYYGLEVDGVAGSQTLAALQNDTYDLGGSSNPSVPDPTPVTPVSSSTTVDLQTLLSSRGFYHGAIDGIKGPATEAAILQAQTFYGLEVDGVAGSRTIAALQADPYNLSGDSNPSTPPASTTPPITNVSSSSVIDLQTLLSTRGFYRGAIDGIKGPATHAAILAAQKFYGLEVDGIAGVKTRSALERDGASQPVATTGDVKPTTPTSGGDTKANGDVKPTAPSSGDATPVAANSGDVKPPATSGGSTSSNPNSMSKADVIELQKLLTEGRFGRFYDGPIDGIYGASTVQAVKDAQRFLDLPEDGIAGAKTIAALKS